MASIKCVRPILMMSLKALALRSSVSRSAVTFGISSAVAETAAAMCMAVGNESFDDCDMLTWSLGWMGVFAPRAPPTYSLARFEMTSLTFMFDCVPLPVCHTTSGKCSSSSPAISSSQARHTRSRLSAGSLPSSKLVSAAAFLSWPKA